MNREYNKILEDFFSEEVDINQEWDKLLSNIVSANDYKQNKRFRIPSFVRYGAAVLAGVLAMIAYTSFADVEHVDLPHAEVCTIMTGVGEKSYVELPDKSKVWINSCTKVGYNTGFGIHNRDIYLSGEAYFDVTKNENLKFVVKTDDVSITALGTAFNVAAYVDDGDIVTTLIEGTVQIASTITQNELTLYPNQVAVHHASTSSIETHAYEKSKHAQWRNDTFSFERIDLKDLTKLLERKFDVSFEFNSAKLENLKFTGTLDNNESLDEILRILEINSSLKNVRRNKKVIIY